MEQELLFYLMLMILSIGIILKFVENGFLEILGKIFHVKFLRYAHWFMSIRIYQIKYHYISVDQSIFDTSIVAKYLDTSTFKTSNFFHKTTLTPDMIFTKDDTYISDQQVDKLTK